MGKRDKVSKDRVNWDSVWGNWIGNWFGNLVERAWRSSLHHFYTSNDDVNLTRSGSFDTGYEVLDDATSSEGR